MGNLIELLAMLFIIGDTGDIANPRAFFKGNQCVASADIEISKEKGKDQPEKLKCSKSWGPDGICLRVQKGTEPPIMDLLTRRFTLTIARDWNVPNRMLIFKRESRSGNRSNYTQ